MMNNRKSDDGFEMASMSNRVLELTVISGEDLRIKGKPIRNNAYAIIKTNNVPNATTKVDQEGGSYPYWDEKLLVDLPLRTFFITVEVRRRTSSGVGQLIGAASIPVSDFIGGYTPENYLHFLSYRLRDAVGERNGIVNVSVRVKSPAPYGCSTASATQPEMGIQSVDPGDGRAGGTVVTGMPVCFPHACRSR
ncbi:BON1-associated protein 2 [Punica granatum]|uniref:BON1-associated protein 2 n=1 Tax=Punica granatum TaxID=22663 RepID=A0A6P8DA51_PUNGR|nr:BON1-associated protein 2 [Punica granatum]